VADTDQRHAGSMLEAVSNAMIRLHKEQFGRGPTHARAFFNGPDGLTCILQDTLLPAEIKMTEIGDAERVRESRVAFQAATEDEFTSAVEAILGRKVRAFASGIDPINNVVFENFLLEPQTDRRSDGA
jgi:uncharacterized protein YbcI